MPPLDVPGFTLRKTAERTYGRSKSSFIRDVDEAFGRGDAEFLKHFRVYLNDETFIEGPDATKEKIQSEASKQPRWYIETSFLESRYWDAGKSPESTEPIQAKASSPRIPGGGDSTKSSSSQGHDVVTVYERHLSDKDAEIQFLRRQIQEQNQQLSNLSQRSQEDNVLLSKFQDLLDQSIRQGGLLVAANSDRAAHASKSDPQSTEQIVDANVVPADEHRPGKGTHQKEKRSPKKQPTAETKSSPKTQENFWTKQRSVSDLLYFMKK